MKLETKHRIYALIGYPLTYLCAMLDTNDKEILEIRQLFKDRIFGKRLL